MHRLNGFSQIPGLEAVTYAPPRGCGETEVLPMRSRRMSSTKNEHAHVNVRDVIRNGKETQVGIIEDRKS